MFAGPSCSASAPPRKAVFETRFSGVLGLIVTVTPHILPVPRVLSGSPYRGTTLKAPIVGLNIIRSGGRWLIKSTSRRFGTEKERPKRW
ncbi:hypothetical protein CORC01_06823 [Colletotrichum orchidophilum]|uniref:Uncharacterized protein n=1 Tax=Colletotrichum orchidophilum TaxID=1209926 RepID=A0A1G4B971_9PEZI|nr:uncharacterized protein CORC01_06823 [Colletotrichum orchidophilum]OHE97960.1 hypothetical protein CORC01_06823 [Colletotrichum orchidophilum]